MKIEVWRGYDVIKSLKSKLYKKERFFSFPMASKCKKITKNNRSCAYNKVYMSYGVEPKIYVSVVFEGR